MPPVPVGPPVGVGHGKLGHGSEPVGPGMGGVQVGIDSVDEGVDEGVQDGVQVGVQEGVAGGVKEGVIEGVPGVLSQVSNAVLDTS